uniref:Putative myosin-11 n=1 Tax=Lutzomyia longipalpis TaxID=7200 RepID=A0A1B0GKL6_LUTLO
MHHLYPISKGDQLCPLGFHPQVRWPTRCKRCFRDYKEHGGKRNPEDIIASSPNLSDSFAKPPARVWTSSQNLSTIPSPEPAPPQPTIRRRPASWTSTPDLAEDEQSSSDAKVDVTVNLPRRRHTAAIVEDTSDEVQNVTIKRPPLPPSSAKTAAEIPNDLVILKSDSLAERYRKMQALKQHRSFERESSSRERSLPRKSEEKEKSPSPAAKKDTEQPKRVVEKAPEAQTKPVERRIRQRSIETIEEAPAPERRARVRSTEVQEKKPPTVAKPPAKPAPKVEAPKTESKITNQDIQFLMHVKNNTAQKKQEDAFSTTTDTTDTTLVGASDKSDRNLIEQIESLKKELEVTKTRCERAERDKSDILLRRLASIDTVPNRTAASEALKLQQKVNEMKQELEDLRDDKRSLSLKVKELESDLDARPAKTIEHELKMKLKQAEALCESLMDENEDIKKELKNMEQEIDEMQDNFRDEQADEYSNVKKELEQTTKNCRILSFKLKKSERKIEQLESEKQALQLSGDLPTKIRQLEEELRLAKDVAKKLQSEVDTKKRAPSLGKIGKSTSADGKITRESLTRGGSQEDPSQLQRDLQDSMEREADLREQLKFAEEEAESFRKKASRIEDENESLMMQLKKMASKNRGTKLGSSSRNRSVEKDEGISDEEDPAELRVLLELNEQEASVLRRKVEELETGNDKKDKQIKELEDRLQVAAKSQKNEVTEKPKLPTLLSKTPAGINAANEKKIKSLEEELSTTKKKLQEKTKEVQQLQDTKSKPQDSNDQQSVNLKRQLQVVESEAAILRTKLQTVEQENDKLATENKKLQLQAARGARKDSIPTQVNSTGNGEELKKLEQEKDALNKQLKELLDATAESLPTRVAKKYSENLTKFQLKTMIEDLEKEVIQYRAIATKCGADKMDKLETDNSKLSNQLKESQDKLKTANSEIKTLKTKVTNSTKSSDLENKLKASEKENNNLVDRVADLEDKISKQEGQVKQLQATNKLLENQVSQAKDEMKKVQEELEKEKREKTRWESKKEREELQRLLSETSTLARDLRQTLFEVERERDKERLEMRRKLDQLKRNTEDEMEEGRKKISDLQCDLLELRDAHAKLRTANEKLRRERDRFERERESASKRRLEQDGEKKVGALLQTVDELVKIAPELQIKTSATANATHLAPTPVPRRSKSRSPSPGPSPIQISSVLARLAEASEELRRYQRLCEDDRERDRVRRGETLKTKVTNSTKSSDLENKLKASEKENNNLVDRVADLEDKISKQEGQVKQLQATNKLLENQVSQAKDEMKKVQEELEKEKREKTRWESKVADMDADLQTARKNTEKVKANLEKEIASLKSKSSNSDAPSKVATQQLKDKVAELEATVAKDVEKYKDLTGKYELLEEEHVLIKAQLTTEKEKAQSEVAALKKKLAEAKDKDSKNKSETETLNKRLSEAKEKIADLEGRNVKMSAIELERNRLKSSLEETERMFEKLKKENEMNADQVMQLKRENDEARKKLDDFERVHKVERSLNDQNALLEQEIKKLRLKVDTTETSMKAEVASTRLRYEQQVTNLQSELSSMHNQCERFKRDRDTFKQLLEGAQKTIHDLKHSSGRHSRASIHSSGDEDDKSKILALEQQVGCLEDELSESRLECSKLKTELVSEKTNSEIKISEMQSQLNEYEEEKVLGSGRTKIPGTKTRLEPSWQKEREELQRLLSETSTLARDLRQTLFEVERERDKERLEMRRKLDQLKRNTEDEMEEGRKKISDLQCDLLELRDAHAKLRTANEKLRRERDRFERERESASKRRLEQDGEKKVGALLQTVDELVKIAPELQIKTSATANATHLAPTPVPRRSKSRSPSPGPSPIQISSVLARLAEASEELRRYQRLCEDDRERDRVRRGGMRRAASTENDESSSRFSSRVSRSSTQNGSLYRKSLSLDQSMQHEQQMIWKQDDDSMSSLQSIDSELGGMVRDSSLDSRLSAGSTQSDLPRGPRKKKRGIMGKLRSLTKTKSVESDASQQGSDSDLSLPGDRERSKKDLKGRLSGMFRRSRGSSMEKSIEDANIPVAVTTIDPHENPEAARKVMVKPPTPLATPSSSRKNKI